MRYQGRLTHWHDAKGYGFITPNGGGVRVFVHRTDFAPGRRPRGDELVTYELTVDAQQRRNARNVQYVARLGAGRRPAFGAMVATVLALAFFAYLLFAGVRGTLPWAVAAWYAALSAATYAIYGTDKSAARQRRGRVPENMLHLMALAGGWPGALVAQRWLRHKSVKTAFLVPFFVTTALNVGALAWLHSPGGAALRGLLHL